MTASLQSSQQRSVHRILDSKLVTAKADYKLYGLGYHNTSGGPIVRGVPAAASISGLCALVAVYVSCASPGSILLCLDLVCRNTLLVINFINFKLVV